MNDRLAYVKAQVQSLQEVQHELERIVFVFNLEEEHRDLFNQAADLIPEYIGSAKVDVVERKNIGLSYGAWSDVFDIYRNDHDYFLFTEDDYFFVLDGFDQYMVKKFKQLPNTGYFCMMTVGPSAEYPNEPVHAGNSIGLSSTKVLNELWEKYGCLPHDRQENKDIESRYASGEFKGQTGQSNAIYQLGYEIWDVRNEYRTPHSMGPSLQKEFPDYDQFVEVYFYWNQLPIIIPAVMKFNETYFYINVIDPQFRTQKMQMLENFSWGPMENNVLKDLLITELFEENIYHRHFDINEGDVVVDVGSSIGPFAYMSSFKKPSQIFTFEPSKEEFPILVKNLKGTPTCHINKAIWDGDGITNAIETYFWNGYIETIKFKTFRELYGVDRIDFLKTDCEGGEYHIFNKENIDYILENVGVIVGEWHLETPERKEMFRNFRDVYLPMFKDFHVYSVDGYDIKWDLYNEHFLQYYKQVILHLDNLK